MSATGRGLLHDSCNPEVGQPPYRRLSASHKVKRALILLAADRGDSQDDIAHCLGVGTATVFRTKRDFVEQGLDLALSEAPRKGGKRKLSDKEELLLVATACSDPPKGRARWTIELLADEMVRLTCHEHIGDETSRRRLHTTKRSSRGSTRCCAFPR